MKKVITKRFAVKELKVGMFVLGLDCPMVTTPFPLDGFYIRNMHQVIELTRYCCFVFVDVVKSLALSSLAESLQLTPASKVAVVFNPNPEPNVRRLLATKSACQYRRKKRAGAGSNTVWAMVCVPLMLSLLAYGEPTLRLWI